MGIYIYILILFFYLIFHISFFNKKIYVVTKKYIPITLEGLKKNERLFLILLIFCLLADSYIQELFNFLITNISLKNMAVGVAGTLSVLSISFTIIDISQLTINNKISHKLHKQIKHHYSIILRIFIICNNEVFIRFLIPLYLYKITKDHVIFIILLIISNVFCLADQIFILAIKSKISFTMLVFQTIMINMLFLYFMDILTVCIAQIVYFGFIFSPIKSNLSLNKGGTDFFIKAYK